jgi:hypothetical protein
LGAKVFDGSFGQFDFEWVRGSTDPGGLDHDPDRFRTELNIDVENE